MIEIRASSFGRKNRTRKLFKELIQTWKTSNFSDILYITPTSKKLRFSLREFERLALQRFPAIIPPHFCTLNTLASSYHLAGKPITDISKHIIIENLIRKTPGTFRSVSTGLVNQVSKLIKEIKIYSPSKTPTELKLDAKTIRNSSVQEKVLKLLNLYSRYSKLLKRMSLVDSEDITKGSIAALKKSKGQPRNLLLLDGFYDVTSLQEMLIRELTKRTRKTVALTFHGEEEIYRIPKAFEEKLKGMGKHKFIKEPLEEEVPQIESSAYKTREDEVEGIARKIKDVKCAHPEIPLNRIFVTFPGIENYSFFVPRIFEKYGIQFSLSPGYTLQSAPPINAIIGLLETIQKEYPRDKFLGTLRSPYFGLVSEEEFAYLCHISLQEGIVKGEVSWKDGLERYIDSLGKRSAYKESPGVSRRGIELITLKIQKIFSKFRRLREKNSLVGFAKLLTQLIDWVEIKEKIKEEESEFRERDEKALQSFFSTLDEISAVQRAGPQKLEKTSLQEFIKILKMGAASTEYIRKGEEFEGVQILGYLETRGLEPDLLFFGGLTNEDLPGAHYQDILLPDSIRRAWCLPTPEDIVERQRLHYHRLIKSAKRRVFLSYPLTVGDALVAPTPFMDHKFRVKKPTVFRRNVIYGEEDRERLKKITPPLRGSISFAQLPSHEKTMQIYVTDLEKFAKCPFQYYVERVLGIEPKGEPTEYVSGVDYGRIVHDIMRLLYQRIRTSHSDFEESFEYAVREALGSLRIEEFWQDVIRDRLSLIRNDLIASDEELRRDGFHPAYTELSQRMSFKIDGERITLKGRLDRVDVSKRSFIVIDYKTGKAPTKGDLQRGLHLQIPIYAWMLKKHLRIPPSAGLIYNLDIEKGFKKITLFTEENADEVISTSIRFLKQYSLMLREGRFPKKERPQNCRNCPYKFLCENFEG